MALEKQVVSLSLTKGLDTKSDSKQQIPGSLVLLENGRFTEPGKIKKRFGTTDLSQNIIGSDSQITSGSGLTSFGEELLSSNGTELFSYSEGNNAWSDKGNLYNLSLEATNVIRNNYQQTDQDSCYHSVGVQCFVWEDSSGGARYSIIDYETKLQLVTNRIITSDAIKPKCYALGNYIVILYHDTSESHLKKMVIPVSNPVAVGVISDAVTDITNTVYDAVIVGTRLFIVYNNNSSGISVRYINAFLTTSAAESIGSTVASSVTIFSDGSSNVWLALWNGTVTRYAIFTYDLTPVLAITTIETVANVKNITGAVVGTTAQIFYDITNAATYNYLIRNCLVTLAGSVGTPSVFIRSLALGGKAFIYSDVIYITGTYQSTLQPTYFILNSSAVVAAKISPLSGGGIPVKNVIPQVNTISTGIYQITYLQKNTTTAVNGVIVSQTGIQQMTIDFTSLGLISTELANNIHMGGGYLSMYDGANLVEHGFHLFPEQPTLVQSAGGSVANGNYQVISVYEWMDNFGNIHRSAPSEARSIAVSGSNGTIQVTTSTLRVTEKENVAVVNYRTENNGTVFYRTSSPTSPTFNNTTVDTVTFNDILNDSSIIGNNQLYTTGGEVENISVPSTKIFTNFKNRVIAVPAENKSQWWYSKQVVPGLPVEFSDSFINNMDQYGGAVRAVGVLDDKIIFFKENNKFYVYGDGPSANGAEGGFSNPERVTGDTGCVNQRSIVSTPMGLMYQSPKGIYLLDRALVDKYIGAPVEQYSQAANVTSAVLMAEVNQARFTMDSGITIVYDYYVDQWDIDTGLLAQDAALWQGVAYAQIRASGQVLVESSDVYTDAGRFIKLKIVTGWISFAQIQGYQRVWKMLLLGEYVSPHRLIVSIAENFNDTPYQQTYINGDLFTGNYGDDEFYGDSTPYGGDFPLYQFRVFLSRQKSEAIQITIEDTQSSDFSEAYNISNLAFEVGAKKGANKLPAANSYG